METKKLLGKHYMNDELDILIENGNRCDGDLRIKFHFKKVNYIYVPRMKELFHWIHFKSKVEDNNYPLSDGKNGRFMLYRFLGAAFCQMTWDDAKKYWQIPDDKKETVGSSHE